MRLPVPRVPAHHPARGGRGHRAQHGARPPLSLTAHLAWSAAIVAGAAILLALELSAPCPPGGPLVFGGDCATVRPFVLGVVALAALLYVAALSGVLAWTASLRRRGLADVRASRDWYLLAAAVGLLVAPMLAFTLLSALR